MPIIISTKHLVMQLQIVGCARILERTKPGLIQMDGLGFQFKCQAHYSRRSPLLYTTRNLALRDVLI
jgi:hypothetical protein